MSRSITDRRQQLSGPPTGPVDAQPQKVATFAALAVIPLMFMVQLAFIVAFGVLLDTLVVRTLLIPALVRDIGPRVWWPARAA